MNETTYGDIILKYPMLIEDGLTFEGREVNVFGRRIDLLFKDEYNRKLIVELKVVPINDKHIGQVLDYYSVLSKEGARLMLVSPNVPLIKKNTLTNLGIEWKEITFPFIEDFLKSRDDANFVFVQLTKKNNNSNLQVPAEVIQTPFDNTIFHHGNGLSEIHINDLYNINKQQNLNIVTFTEFAKIYLRIEERIHAAHQNPSYISYIYNGAPEKSWGFGSSYRQNGETLNQYFGRLFWVHFTGIEPRTMQIDIHDQYLGYFRNTNIPQLNNNFQKWTAGRFLIIRDYLNENTIEEIMDVLCRINF